MVMEPWIGRHHPLALKVRPLVEPVIAHKGLELVDIQYGEGGGGPTLRVFVDGPGGIHIDALQELSGTLGDVLDAEDPMPGRYQLEVSSPGLNRPLTSRARMEAALGEEVLVVTTFKVEGGRKHKGTLSGVDAEAVMVQVEGQVRRIPLEHVDHAHTIYRFETAEKPGKKGAPQKHKETQTRRQAGGPLE